MQLHPRLQLFFPYLHIGLGLEEWRLLGRQTLLPSEPRLLEPALSIGCVTLLCGFTSQILGCLASAFEFRSILLCRRYTLLQGDRFLVSLLRVSGGLRLCGSQHLQRLLEPRLALGHLGHQRTHCVDQILGIWVHRMHFNTASA